MLWSSGLCGGANENLIEGYALGSGDGKGDDLGDVLGGDCDLVWIIGA